MALAVVINLKALSNTPESVMYVNLRIREFEHLRIIFFYSAIPSRLSLDKFSNLLDFKCEHTFVFNECFQLIADYAFTYSGRCSGKNEVTDIYRKIGRNIGYDLIKIMQHKT